MGLFGSKKKTYVATSAVRVIADESLPDSPRTGVIKAIMQNDSISTNLVEELMGSIGNKAERMYEYAKNNYQPGLPTKQFHNRTIGVEEVTEVLSNLEGQAVSVDYSMIGPANFLHLGWMKLTENLGYNPETNTVYGGDTHFLEDMYPVLPSSNFELYDDSSLEMWGVSPKAGVTPYRLSSPGLSKFVRQTTPIQRDGISGELIRIVLVSTKKIVEEEMNLTKPEYTTVEIPLPDLDEESDYFHVKYRVGDVVKYWLYRRGDGLYPSLDNLFFNGKEKGEFYPWLYLRYEKKSIEEQKGNDFYKSTKKLARYLNMDLSSVAEEIHKNPGIDDVEQAMLMFAIPANTTNSMERDYLFRFFNDMYLSFGGSAKPQILPTTRPGIFLSLGMSEIHTTVIQDKKFQMSLTNGGIFKVRKRGQLGPVGTVDSGFEVDTYEIDAVDSDGNKYKQNKKYDYHYFRKQVSDWLYDEITVIDLRMKFHIYGNHVATGDNEDSPILLIPLDREIMSVYSMGDKEILFSRGLHFIFNSRVTVNVKWYQTGIFQAVLIIIAIVITIFTYGSTWQSLGAALAAGGTAAVIALKIIFIGILKAILFGIAFKLFVNAVGEEFALFVAVIAIAYGAYDGFTSGFGEGTFANNLLSVGNGLSQAVGSSFKEELENLMTEYQTFTETSTTMYEELSRVSRELFADNPILSPTVIFGEAPDAFFNRTVHSGNIGTQSLTAVGSFVDYSLRLPTINETLSF